MTANDHTTVAVLAEKPSVARDIAAILGATTKGDGYLHGNGYVVTWAIGHLASLAQPHEINPAWKQWRRDSLPMLPAEWPLVVYDKTKQQFEVVRKILNSPRVASLVCATDAGREGELIFRYIYEAAGCTKPVQRLWISSLTPDAIRKGFSALRPGADYEPLADAARGRSRADWLVGMNLSRAYTLAYGEDLSVGRVQTPTLAMLVERELTIRNFVAEDYLEVEVTFHPQTAPADTTYKGTFFRPQPNEPNATEETLRQSMRLPADGVEAAAIVERARTGAAAIESISSNIQRMAPPALYDLTELQRHANRLFGFSAQKTLELAQALYERHKLLSYPRTDSRHLSHDVAATLPRIVQAIAEPYQKHLAPGTGERPLNRRFVDDAKVTDHHAIIPTATRAGHLSPDEQRIYDLVCRRLLSAWHDDHITSVTTLITAIVNGPIADRYHSSGSVVQQLGWKALDLALPKKKARGGAAGDEAEETVLPPGLAQGDPQDVIDAAPQRKRTRPPKRYTEATLLTAMETAGKTLDEKELSDAMKETGLGTPATRASIIEVLLTRGYMVRSGKSLEATDKGIRLIEIVHPEVKSPAMTGQWEAYLTRIHRGKAQLDPFLRGIENYVREVVGKVGAVPAAPRKDGPRRKAAPSAEPPPVEPPTTKKPRKKAMPSAEAAPAKPKAAAKRASATYDQSSPTPAPSPAPMSNRPAAPPRQAALWDTPPPALRTPAPHTPAPRPTPQPTLWDSAAAPAANAPHPAAPTTDLAQLLHSRFGFAAFRPNQEAVCRALVDGHDALLVMPTGSGKSLCYQLPGIALGGATLVISPLIALMEDQAAKLSALGFHAACIHSGRDRAYSRQACLDYCNGSLHFLFIAPERLRVAGFPEMLARHKPSLIAIDEAHCISQWGHDFRPDYRMLGQHLPALRPAPVIALTATATPQVQDDIATQLALDHAHRFIHGFRRANIAIEVVETTPSQRPALAHDLLLDDARRPGIVYVPTRKQAESLAAELAESFSARAYHAGLDADHRRRVQDEFQSGVIEVMVATIAFGMGIDKPNIRTVIHTALPGSIEAYYQEIGRAGRDGLPSRALLMHSYADRYTHDFFLERDYPDVSVLDLIHQRLSPDPIAKADLQRQLRLEADLFDKALEKLWTHGGALVDYAENVALGSPAWRDSYITHGKQKRAQIEQVIRYAEAGQCRMSSLVRHFGDHEGSLAPCGICDFCAPAECEAQRFRPPTAAEVTIFERLRAALRNSAPRPTGKLFTELVTGELERDEFENLLAAMAAAGHAQLTESVFEKDGRQIPYRTVHLTFAGKDMDSGAISELVIKDTTRATSTKPSRKRTASKASSRTTTKSAPATKSRRAKRSEGGGDAIHPDDAPLEQALRSWRLEEARKKRIPAFRIFSDRVLRAIAEDRPTTLSDLTAIPGVGLKLAEKYAKHIFRIVGENAGR